MDLLQAGADTASIALFLGHSDSRSTQPYLHADLTQKRRMMPITQPAPSGETGALQTKP